VSMDAFFDASHIQRRDAADAFVVGGVLFEKSGLAEFNNAWQQRIANLPGPFRTSQCNAGRDAFEGMPKPERLAMFAELAALTGKTRDVGFTVVIEQSEYEQFAAKNPGIVKETGSPYTIALVSILEASRNYVSEKYPEEKIHYWFEAGTENEAEAKEFMRRIDDRPQTKEYFRMDSQNFVAKEQAAALCAADFVAWEWQRNYKEAQESERLGLGNGQWRDNFKLLFPNENSPPIIPQYISGRSMEFRALFNMIYKVHRD
jgi:hypothetical protein